MSVRRADRSSASPPSFADRDESRRPVDILLVDDHGANLMALEEILRNPAWNLVRASSGREALRQILSREFALILLDVRMPDMDGFETAQMIRARDQSRHIPIIFLTALDHLHEDVSRGYAVGAVDFLFKPLNPDILRFKVQAFADLHSKSRELQYQAERLRRLEREEHQRRFEEVQVQRDRFFSLSHDMLAVLDAAGEIREANVAWETTLGIPLAELRGTPVADLFFAEDRPKILDALRSLQEGRGFPYLEAAHQTRRGLRRWFSWTLLSFPNEAGGYVVARDVTDRLRTERQLQDAFENAPVGAHWIGPDGKLLRANAAELALLGYAAEDYVGRPFREVHVDPAAADELLKRLLRGETVRDYPARLRCRDATIKDVLIDANALFEGERFIHGRGYLRDVTAQRQAQRRQAVNYETTRILADAASFSQAAPRLLAALGNGFGWSLAALWLVDPRLELLRCQEIWEAVPSSLPDLVAETRSIRLKRGEGLPGRVWESRKAFAGSDPAAMPKREPFLRKYGLTHVFVSPILSGDEVLGVLEFFGPTVAMAEEELTPLLGAIGSQVGQFLERRNAEDALVERSARVIRHQAALLEMTSGAADDLQASLRRITEAVGRTLEVDRAGVWLLDETRSALVCRDVYRFKGGVHGIAPPLELESCPRYMSTLEASGVVAVEDAAADPRTVELMGTLLRSRRVRSLMDVAIRHHGKLAGVLRLKHAGPRAWTVEELEFASSVADRIALALLEAERRRDEEEIRRLNTGLEARIEERTRRLRESLEEQEQFAYSVSHDLRAPLRAMSGFSQALMEDYSSVLDSTAREYARRILAATVRMDTLIKDLLTYSRISRSEIESLPIDLGELVTDVLQQLSMERAEGKAEVEIEEPLLSVRGHAVTLRQVVTNLVMNALKFVRPGEIPQVRIRTEARGDKVRLWVEDHGIGIAPEHQERIFQVFERIHLPEKYPGTGIGLAIVRKALTRMGGTTGVESDGHTGSRFWIELPAAKGTP